jgi:hypothetical protein
MPDCARFVGEIRTKFATGSLNAAINSKLKVSSFGRGNDQMQASGVKSSVFDAHSLLCRVVAGGWSAKATFQKLL